MNLSKQFLVDSEKKAFDSKHRNTINQNLNQYQQSHQKSIQQYKDYELAKNQAAYIKTQALENLDKYLSEFEENFTRNGGKVIWAENAKEALTSIKEIIEEKNIKKVIKSKSMTTEEIGLNDFLEDNRVQVLESDLGEYILQLAEQKPYHIVTPAMHLSKDEISDIFKKNLEVKTTNKIEELTEIAKKQLRGEFQEAELGITGANFLVADVGGVAITENEGNARLSTTFPKIHIAIAGIEKIIPSIENLDLFWSVLASNGTGQKITAYNSLFTAPKKTNENDGSEEMYVILLDNGRTKLLADTQKRQALNCIRCGACMNVCPIFQNIGGHNYKSVYGGPIGSVITPHYEGMKKFKHLSQASSLCGACGEICPVKIDLPQLLLDNRKEITDKNLNTSTENLTFSLWKRAMMNRKRMIFWHKKSKIFAFKWLFNKNWKKRRNLPKISEKSFNQIWKEKLNSSSKEEKFDKK